jgi:hypothetical protein
MLEEGHPQRKMHYQLKINFTVREKARLKKIRHRLSLFRAVRRERHVWGGVALAIWF